MTRMHADAIDVKLNGERHRVERGTTLAQLLERADIAPPSCTTAVNGEFVPRNARTEHALQPDDAVTCFQAIVGG